MMQCFDQYLFELTRLGFCTMHSAVGGQWTLAKARAGLLDVDIETIVLVLGNVRVLRLQVGFSVDLGDIRLRSGLRGRCKDHCVDV